MCDLTAGHRHNRCDWTHGAGRLEGPYGGALSENVIAQGDGSGEAVGGGGKPAGAGGDLVTGFAHSEANCPAQE